MIARSDPREHQELRGIERSARENDFTRTYTEAGTGFAARICVGAVQTFALEIFNANRAVVESRITRVASAFRIIQPSGNAAQ